MSNQLNQASQSAAKTMWSELTSGIFGRGALSFLLATAGVSVSNFAFHVVVSRVIGPDQYGALGAILGVINLLSVPIIAIQIAATQAVVGRGASETSHNVSKMVQRVAIFGVIGAALMLACAAPLDSFLHLTSPMSVVLVAVWIPFAAVGAALQGALIGEYRFRPAAFATFVGGGPIRLLLGAVLGYMSFGVTGAIAATLIAQIFTTVSLSYSSRHHAFTNKRGKAVTTSVRDIVFSVCALAGFTILTNIDTFLSRHYFSANLAGQYAAGAIAAHIALLVPTAIVTVAFPLLADGNGISDASRRAFMQSLKIVTLLGLIFALGMILFSSLLVSVLFGAKYGPAVTVIRPLAIESAGLGVLNLLIYLHLARRSYVSMISWLAVALVAVVTALRHHSMVELALIMLVATGAVLIAGAWPAWKALTTAAARRDVDQLNELILPTVTVDLTLVVPFHNPGPGFAQRVTDCVNVLGATGLTFEILAVSDGSTDHSEDSLPHLKSETLRVLQLEESQGNGAALREGLLQGRGRYLGFMNSDGALSPNLLLEFAKVIHEEGPDIAFGSKRHPQSKVAYPPLRRLFSFTYEQLTRLLFRAPLRDTQTGIKVIRRDVLIAVLPSMVEKNFGFDLELFVVAREMGYSDFVEIPVEIDAQFPSTVSLKSVGGLLWDTLAIFYRLRILRYYERATGPSSAVRLGPDDLAGVVRPLDVGDGLETAPAPRRDLRILILNWRDVSHPNAGGAEIYTESVARHWISKGHHVTLFCAEIAGRPHSEVVDGLHIIRRGSRYSVYREARKYYRNEGRGLYDLVVDEINTRPFLSPKWVDDVPVVGLAYQVCRELWYLQMPFPFSWVGHHILEPMWLKSYHSTKVVTISQSSRESLLEYGMQDVHVVPVGGSIQVPVESLPREARPTVVFVGRLEAHKRPQEAIRAFSMLHEQDPRAVMWVIGTGPMEAQLRKSSPPGVQFLGAVSHAEKFERLQRAHVLIATSVREGWGLVVSEAAAMGTPAIAYDVAGLRDSVSASCGILTAPNPEALGRTLCEYFKAIPETGVPTVSAGGTLEWGEVADMILGVAIGPKEPAL
jgi:glycosyltransferase involved in cell wall biosynthesis/O-antigen/teichoic acid export membrane protein